MFLPHVLCTMDHGNLFAHLFEQLATRVLQRPLFWTSIYYILYIYCHIIIRHLQDGRTEIPEIGTGTSETETGRMRLDLSGNSVDSEGVEVCEGLPGCALPKL